MRQIKLLSLTFMAMFALSGAMAAVASAAAPNILPEGTAKEPLTGISTSGLSTFAPGALKVESVKSEGTFSGNEPKSGTFDQLFLETTLEKATCTGLDDTTPGSVLAKGTFDVRHYNLEGKLLTAEIFLLKELHFECGETLIRVKGCVAGELTPNEEKLVEKLTVTLKPAKGDNVPVKVLNEGSTGEENCELLASIGTGAFKLSTQTQTISLSGFKKGGNAVTVLVMPL